VPGGGKEQNHGPRQCTIRDAEKRVKTRKRKVRQTNELARQRQKRRGRKKHEETKEGNKAGNSAGDYGKGRHRKKSETETSKVFQNRLDTMFVQHYIWKCTWGCVRKRGSIGSAWKAHEPAES